MVAIISHLRYWGLTTASLLLVALFSVSSHTAMAVTPRISALSGDSTYMALLNRAEILINQEDSLNSVLTGYRDDFAAGGAQASHSRSSIMRVELELFDVRGEHNTVSGNILDIEQQWTIENGGVGISSEQGSAATASSDGAATIAGSKLAREKLSNEDYENLKRAEAVEAKCAEAFDEYMKIYDKMLVQLQLYNQTDSEEEATSYSTAFFTMKQDADALERVLAEDWSTAYDNKDFAYSMLMEVMAYDDLLARSGDMARECEGQIAAAEVDAESEAVVRYNFQKRNMVAVERMLSEKLMLQKAVDSLSGAATKLSKMVQLEELPKLQFVKRNFMLFEPVLFSTTPVYDANNPIPETVIYKKGTIYRIHYGAFNAKQSPNIFRGAYPLSYDRTGGLWTYYGGGYQTYAEAEEAAALCKAKGFRRPEVVIWRDGESRNLARDPFPKDQKYRVQIAGLAELTDDIKSVIATHCPEAELSKIGVDRYVVSPIVGQLVVDEFTMALESANGALTTEVIEIVEE